MSEPWDRRTFPVTFQLRTESNLDRVELYCSSNKWASSLARLQYAYKDAVSSQQAKYVYLNTISLLPGDYEYKFEVNNKKPWVLNTEKQIRNNNNVLTKNDFMQLIMERCDLLERERAGATVLVTRDQTDHENANVNYCSIGTLLFKDPALWDTELIVNRTEHYKTHRAIISVHSGYFRTLFGKGDMKTPAEIHVETNDLRSFHIMFKFLYTGMIPISFEHKQLKSLSQIANTYQIPTLVEIIQQNLASTNIDVNNCLSLCSMENELQHDWLRVRRLAVEIIVADFRYLCHQDVFLSLSYSILQDVLCHPSLRIPNKRMANMALHRWLIANKENIPDLSRSSTI